MFIGLLNAEYCTKCHLVYTNIHHFLSNGSLPIYWIGTGPSSSRTVFIFAIFPVLIGHTVTKVFSLVISAISYMASLLIYAEDIRQEKQQQQ